MQLTYITAIDLKANYNLITLNIIMCLPRDRLKWCLPFTTRLPMHTLSHMSSLIIQNGHFNLVFRYFLWLVYVQIFLCQEQFFLATFQIFFAFSAYTSTLSFNQYSPSNYNYLGKHNLMPFIKKQFTLYLLDTFDRRGHASAEEKIT